jgi:N-acetylmuramoyl-L-alanine amidase
MKILHLMVLRLMVLSVLLCVLFGLAGCATPRVGSERTRRGDEIVVAGRMFHTGHRVILWMDPGGYDAYRVERRFVPWQDAAWKEGAAGGLESPNRYGLRRGLTPDVLERVRGGGWDLATLREKVDQFVLHYDVSGTSRTCFRVLHDMRGLSVHFMIDIDGTIYQTLDVKERAWHAAEANDRSVGVEIAQIGAYPVTTDTLPPPLPEWYARDAHGTRITLPARLGDGGVRTPAFIARPSTRQTADGLVKGAIHGVPHAQYDFTDEQYAALNALTRALHASLPRIALRYPTEADGTLMRRAMTTQEWENYSGVLGHYHVTDGKVDPGPAMDWTRVIAR